MIHYMVLSEVLLFLGNMKYILHPSLELIAAADITARDIVIPFDNAILHKIQIGELFIIGNVNDHNFLVINPTIHFFINLLKTPSTFSEILTQFALSAECTEGVAQPIVQSFFNDMLNREIIISHRKALKIQKVTETTPDTTDANFLHFKILKSLKDIPNNFTHIHLVQNTITSEIAVLKRLIFPFKTPKKEQKYWKKLFFQEFEIINEIGHHPQIGALNEVNTEGGYAILEYIEGDGLKSFLQEHNLTFQQKHTLISKVLSALAAVHEKRILHGDIHASNFLITNDLDVKLIDFDLANREKPLLHEWVNEGGVPEYIAPEKINKNSFEVIKERADYRSEVYQLGVIAYIILFNRLPFEALTWHELTDKILHEEPSFEKADLGSSPESVLHFLKKSMDKNPQNRFSNASEMLNNWLRSAELQFRN